MFVFPYPQNIILHQMSEWCTDCRHVWDELCQVIYHARYSFEVLLAGRIWHLGDGPYFLLIWLETVSTGNVFNIHDFGDVELALISGLNLILLSRGLSNTVRNARSWMVFIIFCLDDHVTIYYMCIRYIAKSFCSSMSTLTDLKLYRHSKIQTLKNFD